MRYLFILSLLFAAHGARADTVFATETLRAKQIVTADLVDIQTTDVRGAATSLDDVVGFELTRAVYAGKPILLSNLERAALVERNQRVRVLYKKGLLKIEIEARALERGAVGDFIEVMNLSSRKTIIAEVLKNGQLSVSP